MEVTSQAADDVRQRRKMSPNSDAVEMEDRRLAYASSHSQEPIASTNLGSLISFHNINYEVMVKKQKKVILDNISGIFGPGMNAIMGPTGGGKSSCLDVLAGRKDPAGLSGNVLIDGKKQPPNFKSMCGYVLQDDIVMGTLTVKENLMFSAQVRLAEKVTVEQKNQRVIRVIKELGLQACANTRVGTEFVRGISSSERKRCNIGIEMITLPPVLFLDEPTTGLDSNTASSVCKLLLKLAKRGRTIIFSIHQPRYSIFKLFDRLLLLARGEVMYHGDAQAAVHYLDSIGYPIEEFNNPADFFLDVINADTEADEDNKQQEQIELNRQLEQSGKLVEEDARFDRITERHVSLIKAYGESEYKQLVDAEVDPMIEKYKNKLDKGEEVAMKDIDHATTWLHEMRMLAGRAAVNTYRSPQTTFVQAFVMIAQAFVIGIIYLQVGENPDDAISNRTGAFFLILTNMVFGNISSVDLFIRERPIFIHENISGFYRVSVYFFAKITSDLLPRRFVPTILFSTITYFLIGLQLDVGKFFFFMLTLLLANTCGSGLAFAVSASVNIYVVASMITNLFYTFMMVFAGLLVNLSTMPTWISWIRFLSIQYYAFNALNINELKNEEYCNEAGDCAYGNQFLTVQGIDYDTSWDMWKNIVGLSCLSLGFLTLAYIQLLRLKKLK